MGGGASRCQGSGERSLIGGKATPVAAKLGFKSNCFPSWSLFEQESVAAGAQQPQCDFNWGSLTPVVGAVPEHQPSWGKCPHPAGLILSC